MDLVDPVTRSGCLVVMVMCRASWTRKEDTLHERQDVQKEQLSVAADMEDTAGHDGPVLELRDRYAPSRG